VDKVTIHICLGLTCGPLGNNQLIAAVHALSEDQKKRVQIVTHNCYARCSLSEGVCPCVRFDDEDFIDCAEPKTTLRELRKRLAALPQLPASDDPFAAYFE
jgi:NADH:ubiquinone oxidoreductase subunit E